MKAVRLHQYEVRPLVENVAEPVVTHPFDVVVRVGGAGLCRTDLHIVEGQWAAKSNVALPYTLGHENAGWVHAVGSAVEHVQVGDAVILHPLVTCGFWRACRAGDDVHCEAQAFPGIDTDGGMAELIKTSARSVVKLGAGVEPAAVAALADAGLTAYHAVKKAVPLLHPGTTCVVMGAGGLGHIVDAHVGETAGREHVDGDVGDVVRGGRAAPAHPRLRHHRTPPFHFGTRCHILAASVTQIPSLSRPDERQAPWTTRPKLTPNSSPRPWSKRCPSTACVGSTDRARACAGSDANLVRS